MTVQLEYINHLLLLCWHYNIICLMLSVIYYAQNYTGIISWSLAVHNTYIM